jgi:hypothetical protein
MGEKLDVAGRLLGITTDLVALTEVVWRDSAAAAETGLPAPRVSVFLASVRAILEMYVGVPGPELGRVQMEALREALVKAGREIEELWLGVVDG